jgi:hypothetical protein
MLQDIKGLYGSKLVALDGPIGHVKDFYFDDKLWVVRYLVADTGSWLTGRLVLISPHAFAKFNPLENTLRLKLNKKQIQDSPSIDTHEPVSQQFEDEYYRSYGWPAYWQGGQMWGMSGYPLVAVEQPRDIAARKALEPRADRHLQSAKDIVGFQVVAVDGAIGHLSGLMVDDRSWAVRELVVEAGHWYSGKEILIPSGRVERISCEESKVFVSFTKADIQETEENHVAKAGAGKLATVSFLD